MFTKPHYRQIMAADVVPGMRIYSHLLGEAFTVEKVENRGGMLRFIDGCFALSRRPHRLVWQETKPRGLV